jgi:multiple sugar transport system permease protein
MSSSSALRLRPRYRRDRLLARSASYLLLGILALLCIVPFYLMLANATRTNNQILSGVSFIPGGALIDNFTNLIFGKLDAATGVHKEGLNIPQGFLNSFIIAACSTLLSGYFGAMTAYGFSLYKFRGKKIFWGIIMATIMIPPTVSLIGFYKLIAWLNLLDSYWPLIVPAVASPFAVFFLRQYISGALSLSLVEAARMDGASEMRIFHTLGLPISLPGIATISIMGFLGSWNSYLVPLIVITTKKLNTLPLLIQQLNSSLYNRDFGAMYMGISLSVIPILILFAFFSRYLIEGVSAGSLKG